jgi:hypothetical protein
MCVGMFLSIVMLQSDLFILSGYLYLSLYLTVSECVCVCVCLYRMRDAFVRSSVEYLKSATPRTLAARTSHHKRNEFVLQDVKKRYLMQAGDTESKHK